MNFCLETSKKRFLLEQLLFLFCIYGIVIWAEQNLFLLKIESWKISRFSLSNMQPLERGLLLGFGPKKVIQMAKKLFEQI